MRPLHVPYPDRLVKDPRHDPRSPWRRRLQGCAALGAISLFFVGMGFLLWWDQPAPVDPAQKERQAYAEAALIHTCRWKAPEASSNPPSVRFPSPTEATVITLSPSRADVWMHMTERDPTSLQERRLRVVCVMHEGRVTDLLVGLARDGS